MFVMDFRLKFASRAKRVQLRAHINETVDEKALLLQYVFVVDHLCRF